MEEVEHFSFLQLAIVSKIKQEVNIISSVNEIFKKMDEEKFLKPILESIQSIMNNEMKFAITRLHDQKKNEGQEDLKRKIITNLYIFKENLKIICSTISLINS